MKSFGKGLFWIGFILLMGVVIAYMIIMFAGVVVYASWSTSIAFCGLILLGGLFMLIGRTSERRAEEKRHLKELEAEVKNNAANTTESSDKI
ncbi:MAG: hypothetical protein NC411_03070 [Bacteroides sp.]|nr:hypothetical protein [Bacteroides sp.]